METGPPPAAREDYRALGLLIGVFSAALLVLGGYWVSNCIPVGGVCTYPGVGYGGLLIGLAAVLFVPALALVLPASRRPSGNTTPVDSPPALVTPEAAPPVDRPTRCNYCGSVTDAPARLCRTCARPLAWSNPPPRSLPAND